MGILTWLLCSPMFTWCFLLCLRPNIATTGCTPGSCLSSYVSFSAVCGAMGDSSADWPSAIMAEMQQALAAPQEPFDEEEGLHSGSGTSA